MFQKTLYPCEQDGNYLGEFGSAGLLEGQFDEPVGLTLDKDGRILIVDTWNQRVQVFQPDFQTMTFTPVLQWDIVGWYGQSLDNKPFIAADDSGYTYISDPEGYRILQFDMQGEFIRYWGDYGTDVGGFNLPTGLAIGKDGSVWVVDTGNHRLLHFSPPEVTDNQSLD